MCVTSILNNEQKKKSAIKSTKVKTDLLTGIDTILMSQKVLEVEYVKQFTDI